VCARAVASDIAPLQLRGQSGGTLPGTIKGRSKPMFTRISNSSHDVPATVWDIAAVSKMNPMIVMGLL
jgi:hypothetical protein